MTGSRRQPRRARSGRTRILIGAGIFAALLLGTAAGLAVTRYLPALDEARVVRADLEKVLDRTRDAGLAMDRATLTSIEADFASLVARFERLDDLLAGDPLVGVAGALPRPEMSWPAPERLPLRPARSSPQQRRASGWSGGT